MDTRAQRVESIVTWLVNRPGEAEKLTGATVEKMYAEHGVEVSSRQIRRDIETHAASPPTGSDHRRFHIGRRT